MKKQYTIFILVFVILCQIIGLFTAINNSSLAPAWDQSWHAMISHNLYSQLSHDTKLTTSELEKIYPIFGFAVNYYPPLFHLAAMPFYFMFGEGYDSAVLSNLLFLFILATSMFFIGKKIKNAEVGIFLAVITISAPGLNYLLYDYLIDYSLVAMVSLSYMFLLYSENFTKLGYSILFGISLGLSMLTKWTSIIFLLVPIYFSMKNFSKKKKWKKEFHKLIIPFIVAILLASTWYLPRFGMLLNQMSYSIRDVGLLEGDPAATTLNGIGYYLFGLIESYSLYFFMLFCIALIFGKRDWKLITNIMFIFTAFTVLPNKDMRYILPIIPFFSIVIISLNAKILVKTALICAIFLALTINFFPGENMNVSGTTILYRNQLNTIGHPDYSGILHAIKENSNENASVCIIAESKYLNDINIPYHSMIEKTPISYMIGNGCNPIEFDYSILGDIENTWRSEAFKKSKEILISNQDRFQSIYDSGGVAIYKRT